jgi:hypothetical protein
MISHEYRCIFIHIQRCAGSSIEAWIAGRDWWQIEKNTKHLLASQAKQLYAEYWPRYFKFAFVREPVGRTLSMLKYAKYYGLRRRPLIGFDFEEYHQRFGTQVVLEHDYRFYQRASLLRDVHGPGCVYSNILDEELDFIGSVESLEEDLAVVARQIGMRTPFTARHQRTPKTVRVHRREVFPWEKRRIARLYERDYDRFDFSRRAAA